MQIKQPWMTRVPLVLAMSLIVGNSALAQTERVIYSLGVAQGDGAAPLAGLVFDQKGDLYGTTALGHGHGLNPYGSGTVFKLVHTGSGWKETVLHTFVGSDGAVPAANLILDQQGSLYGTTSMGGASNAGVVFKIFRNSSGWHNQVLYSFTGLNEGGSPCAGVIRDAAGNLYGTTELGGTHAKGTVFELSHGTNGWTEKVLYNFGPTGKFPFGGLIFDAAGSLYGTTKSGGTAGLGSVYRLSLGKNGTWKATALYSFLGNADGKTDGKAPYGAVVFDGQGNLYGTTKAGGRFNGGIVFQLQPSLKTTWTERVLTNGGAGHGGGKQFLSDVVFDASGRLYGTGAGGGAFTSGVVYRLTPRATGTWTNEVLYAFTGLNDGGTPMGGVVLDAKGNIFGTTYTGGEAGNGAVFEITP
jgi:uncharacterized repeat protein (TIGR03803 family)